MVWHVVLHGDDLQELVVFGFLYLFNSALIRGLIRHIRRIVNLILMRDDVRTGQRIEVRESELLIVGGARIHGRFVWMKYLSEGCGSARRGDRRLP